MTAKLAGDPATIRLPSWLVASLAVLLLTGALTGLALLAGRSLPDRAGPPVEQLAVERSLFTPGSIELTIRNTGPDPVQVAQVYVNDTYVNGQGPPSQSVGCAPRPCGSSTHGRSDDPTSYPSSPPPAQWSSTRSMQPQPPHRLDPGSSG